MDKEVTDVKVAEALARLRSRKEFIKMAGAAGLGAALASNVLLREAAAVAPTDFSFSITTKFRPFNLLAQNFIQLEDSFDTDTTGDYTILRPGPDAEDDGTVEAGGGTLRFDGEDDYYTVLKSETGQEAPYATVIIEVASLPEGDVFAGLYRDEDNYVHAYYDNDTKTVGLEAVVGGVVFNMGSVPADEQRLFDAPFRFAFVANENEVTALVGDRSSEIGDFRPIIKRDVRQQTAGALDLRDETVLETYRNGFGARSGSGATIVFDRGLAGYFGEAGVRDPHVIQYADGTPYIKNGKLYFTLTNAGLGFFEKAHWAVWTMDLSDYTKIEQIGNIFWRNAPPDDSTKVLGHHAGQIVRDEANDRWIVLVSSWGDFGPQGGTGATAAAPPVDILYDEVPISTNLLRGVHILTGEKHPVNAVPAPSEGKWDPGLTRIDGTWYFAYVIAHDLFSDFNPALAKSPPGGDHTTLTFVGEDAEKVATEGPIIQKLDEEWRVLASCGDDEPAEFQGRYPMYTLDMVFDGYLDAPHPTNIPHPMVVPIPRRINGRRRTEYIMITFNGNQYYEPLLGYGTHGDFIVMEGRPILRGYVFPPRNP